MDMPKERSALSKVLLFGIIQLVGIGVGWLIAWWSFVSIFSTVSSLGLGPSPNSAQVGRALGPLFQYFGYMVMAVVAVGLVGLVVLTLAFRDFRGFDRGRFSTPFIFMIIMIIGSLLVAGGLVPLFNQIPTLIANAPAGSSSALPPAFSAAIGTLFATLIIISVGALLAFAGLVGGQILGLWRVGSRYDKVIIKVGAIFTVIPLLNIAAPILLIIGTNEARGQLAQPR